MKTQTLQQLAAINRSFYDSPLALEFSRTRRRPWRGWPRLLERLSLGPAPRVLDVGCGDGRFAAFLAERGLHPHYLGLDTSPRLLQLADARRLPCARFEHRDVTALAGWRTDERFDLIVAFGLLHHIAAEHRRGSLIHALGQRLAVGGRLCVTVWHLDSEPDFADRVVGWDRYAKDRGQALDVADLEPGDTLLRWGPQTDGPVRYCHFPDEAEIQRWLARSGLHCEARFRSDGRGDRLNEYFLLYCPP